VINYEVDVTGVDRLILGLRAAPEVLRAEHLKATSLATLTVEAAAKNDAPVKTGRLRSSIHSDVRETATGTEGHVGTSVTYASVVEFGSAAHDITPVSSRALTVPLTSSGGFGGGRLSGSPRSGQSVAFYARVHHPGTKGAYFMRRALEESKGAIQAIYMGALQRVALTIKGI
jgi:HK97 gp10 family phage protein